MQLNGTTTTPVLEPIEVDSTGSNRFALKVFNNETANWQQIISVLMLATKCTQDEAYAETWEIDKFGSALVHFGTKEVLEPMVPIIGRYAVSEIVPEFLEKFGD